MQINFTQIFQDSLNFMRNQRKTVLIFIGIFVISQLIIALVSVPMPSLGDNPNPSQQDIIDALSKVEPTALIGSFFPTIIDVFYCDLRYCNHSSY